MVDKSKRYAENGITDRSENMDEHKERITEYAKDLLDERKELLKRIHAIESELTFIGNQEVVSYIGVGQRKTTTSSDFPDRTFY